MTDLDLAEESLALWFGEPATGELFHDRQPTDRALRLFADEMLATADAAAVAAAVRDPRAAARLAAIVALREARKAAMLGDVLGDRGGDRVIVSVSARADAMRRLARPQELSVAASSAFGGVVQTTDPDDLVTLRIVEVFEPDAQDGELDVEIRTFDDPELVSPHGTLQVAVGTTTLHEYAFVLRDRRFHGRFPIRRIPYPSTTIEFRLHLSRPGP
jgi:hypothetical protein